MKRAKRSPARAKGPKSRRRAAKLLARTSATEEADARRAAILAPNATDSPEELADWVELQALLARDRQFSLESLARVINRSGTTDALRSDPEEDDGGDDPPRRLPRRAADDSRTVAEAAFSEIETRAKACNGHRDAYPFKVESGIVRLKGEPGSTDYEFFLLLTHAGPTSGHEGTAVLFELLCTVAALGHLGGSRNSARAFRFGAPRKRPLAKLSEAITNFCRDVGEGMGCSSEKEASHTGDGQLDIVAFREFPDGRTGKLVLFGQCAAGASSAEDKLSELDPQAFMKKWLKKQLLVSPMRLFFVPWCPPAHAWEFKVIDSGLLFDRCRIAACIEDTELTVFSDRIKAANKVMLRKLKRVA